MRLIIARPPETLWPYDRACPLTFGAGTTNYTQSVGSGGNREYIFSNSYRKVHQTLKTLAMITERKASSQKSSSKADKMLLSFLDNQLLGIMAHFSDIIDVSRDRQTTADKKRCLHGVETLIAISKGHINIALPQVC